MKFNDSNIRVVAAVVLFFVFGFLFISAKSISHELVEHAQHADGSRHTQQVEHDDDSAALSVSDSGHSHEHDPSDHTHDIPLRLVLASQEPAFVPTWEASTPFPLHSISIFPLERPPKLNFLA